MPSLSDIKASNTAYSSTYRPTALFVGGTSGCGEGTAGAFARATQGDIFDSLAQLVLWLDQLNIVAFDPTPGRAHILICGRNREAAEKIIASFPKHPESKYEFVECDATLMKNVVKAAEDVKHKISEADGKSKLNYLVVSQGIMTMNGFDPTSEGIDKKMALHFYSRWKFVDELLPLLEKASSDGEEARMMSILAPGTAGALDTTDFGLKKNYSVTRAGRQAPGYNDNFVAEYAASHPNVSFIHIMPGFVNTPLAQSLPWYFKPLISAATMFSRSISDCGEYMISALLNPAYKTGGFWLDQNGDSISTRRLYVGDEDARKKLVEHYTKEVAF